jgi:bifunctional N-acetylglucosamine-1-phosphate-uridyltransferase/glucosamine-1-phosphate-acetyltransferase GlmU-like protein
VVDFIIGMRSRWQSVALENFITQRIAEVAMFAGVTADLYRRVVLD